jgi:hypothetical protein
MSYSSDIYILRLAWKEYAADRPVDNSSRKSLVSAWRDHVWVIESAWRGVMQYALPPTAWNFLSDMLWRRTALRQIWLEEGGWLFTKRGTRRKRYYKGQRPPRISSFQEEINRARTHFLKSTPPEVLSYLEVVILASSGVIYCAKNGSRKKTVERFRDTFGKLQPAKVWKSPVPKRVLHVPWGKRRLR